MIPSKQKIPARLRFAKAMLAGVMLLVFPLTIHSFTAAADEERSDTAFRLYFALPFMGTRTTERGRLGFQLLSENEDQMLYTPVPSGTEKFTAIDLGFNRDGLAKFDVNGQDMRSAYEAFARAIGLTPDEVELCREADCLDWVKPEEKTGPSEKRLGE